MSELVMMQEQVPQQYYLKVMSELFTQAHIVGIKGEELLEFLATQIQVMLTCPPNYNFFGEKARVWILRGFYPGSTLFFKLTVSAVKSESQTDLSYFAKASPMRCTVTGKGSKSWDAHVTFGSKELNENLTNRMENSFFNANHSIDDLVKKQIRMPRCVSPKGMPLFKYKKKSKR